MFFVSCLQFFLSFKFQFVFKECVPYIPATITLARYGLLPPPTMLTFGLDFKTPTCRGIQEYDFTAFSRYNFFNLFFHIAMQ